VLVGPRHSKSGRSNEFDGNLDKDWYCGLIGLSAAYLVSRRGAADR
jgi:hypothetical protein